MDYRLLFTQRALSDLSKIVGHIAQDDDEAASRFGKALLDHVDLLGRFPRMGNTTRKKSRVRKLGLRPCGHVLFMWGRMESCGGLATRPGRR